MRFRGEASGIAVTRGQTATSCPALLSDGIPRGPGWKPRDARLRHLRPYGFKNFIVSDGGADFMRVWVERVYGIPPEQVVGSTARTTFELRDSGPAATKTLDCLFVNDNEGKPVGIHQFIRRRPANCCGNSDGDRAMLQYAAIGNPRPGFGLVVHHADGEREYACDAQTKSSGKPVDALKEAPGAAGSLWT